MTAINPPFALQNAGATHTAENDRMMLSAMFAGTRAAASLVGRGGVSYAGPSTGGLKVLAQGTPDMTVAVNAGHCYIPGTEGSKQGVYSCTNDATVTVAIATAHASLPRIDIIVAKVQDSVYSGATDAWSLVAVTGTAAGSPVAPSAPANSITLAQVAVAAAVTSINNGNITDTRIFHAATGGVINCLSTSRPATNVIPFGQQIYETDTGLQKFLHTDSSWFPMQPLFARKTADETVTSSATPQNDDHLFLTYDANAVYTVELVVFTVVAGTVVDMNMDFTWGASATFTVGPVSPDTTYAGSTGATMEPRPAALSDATSPSNTMALGSGASGVTATIVGLLVSGGSSGTLQMRWAQNSSNGAGLTMKAGSWMRLIRMT